MMVTSRPRAWSWRRWARILRSRSASAVVPAGAEVGEPGRGVGEEVPDDDEDGPPDSAPGRVSCRRRGDRRAEPFAEEGVRAGGPGGRLGWRSPLGRRRPGPCPACGCGARTGGSPARARPRRPGAPAVGYWVMSRPVSAMMAYGQLGGLGPGHLGQTVRGGQRGRVRAPPCARAGSCCWRRRPRRRGSRPGPRRSRPPARGDGPVQQGDVVEVGADEQGVVGAQLHSLEGLLHGGAAAGDTVAVARAARACGSRSPPAIVFSMSRRSGPASLYTADDSLTRAPSSSFSSRCQSRVRSRPGEAGAGQARSARISGGGTKQGRSRPISVSRAIHRASCWSVFGLPGRFRAWEEFTSCTARPGLLQQVEPPPVG